MNNQKTRSVDPRKSKPRQTLKKTTNNKKTHQRNTKSRSVTIQVPEDRRNKTNEPRSDNIQGHIKPRSESIPNAPISKISDLYELRNEDKG